MQQAVFTQYDLTEYFNKLDWNKLVCWMVFEQILEYCWYDSII